MNLNTISLAAVTTFTFFLSRRTRDMRSGKKTYPPSRRISRLDELNFDCTTSSDTFNCANNFFDLYLPIHHTTFMALRFVWRPFTLRFWLCPTKKWV